MNKLLIATLFLLSSATRLIGQNEEVSGHDNASEFKQFSTRWSGLTLGFKLLKDEELLFQDSSAIIAGVNGRASRIIATYKFDPVFLPPGLYLSFNNVKTVVLGDFDQNARGTEVYEMPRWLTSLSELETLSLSGVEVNSAVLCNCLGLKHLQLYKIRFTDNCSAVETVARFRNLQVLVCDESILDYDLLSIKRELPNLKVVPQR